MRKKIKYLLIIINTHLSAPLKIEKIRAFYITYNQGRSRLSNIKLFEKGSFLHLLKLYILSIR